MSGHGLEEKWRRKGGQRRKSESGTGHTLSNTEGQPMKAVYDRHTGAYGDSGLYRIKKIVSMNSRGVCTVAWEGRDPDTRRPWKATREPAENMPQDALNEFKARQHKRRPRKISGSKQGKARRHCEIRHRCGVRHIS